VCSGIDSFQFSLDGPGRPNCSTFLISKPFQFSLDGPARQKGFAFGYSKPNDAKLLVFCSRKPKRAKIPEEII
jgi:hypothetical protein